ncbi:MAG: Flp family type IVb pilin [Gemmatimonadales bacterium]
MRPRRRLSERGQGLVEYSLILAVASVGVMVALLILRDSLGNTFAGTRAKIDAAATANAPSDGGGVAGQPSGGDPATSDPSSGGDHRGRHGHGHGNGKGNSGYGNGNGGPNGRKD